MRTIRLTALLLAVSVLDAAAQTTAIRFARVWDGERVVENAVVVVESGRIVRVASGMAIPPGATVVDLSRYTGLPGLIDAHTHITYFWDRAPGTRPRGQRRLPAVTVFLAQDNARRTLETGVTTVRDLNAGNDMDFAMRELTRSGAMIGPRIFASGPGLSARTGAAPDPDAMRKLVEERVKAGADWIKVFGSRGGFENVDGTQTVSFDEMRAIVETARQLGKPVAIHSYGPTGVRDAVRAGADSIEHGADLDDETIARDGGARHRVGAHNRSQSLLHRREGRVRLRARFGEGARRLHPPQYGLAAACGQSRRQDRDGFGRGLLDVRAEHARAEMAGRWPG